MKTLVVIIAVVIIITLLYHTIGPGVSPDQLLATGLEKYEDGTWVVTGGTRRSLWWTHKKTSQEPLDSVRFLDEISDGCQVVEPVFSDFGRNQTTVNLSSCMSFP